MMIKIAETMCKLDSNFNAIFENQNEHRISALEKSHAYIMYHQKHWYISFLNLHWDKFHHLSYHKDHMVGQVQSDMI